MRVAICDDIRKEHAQFINALHDLNSMIKPECFTTAAAFFEAAKRATPFDIVFLDIYMPGENGVDIAKKLKEISPKTAIVFLTTSREHAVEAFSLNALHYLIKPVTKEKIEETFLRLTQLLSQKRSMITLTAGHDSYTIYLDEICYVRSASHAKEIFLTEGRMIRVWMTMEELGKKLDSNFLKLNRGNIVNMEQIAQMGIDACVLRDGTRLEFARRGRAAIRSAYDNYLFTRLSERKSF